MKKICFVILFSSLIISSAHARKTQMYKASNGITYFTSDTLLLGRGSTPNGEFKYLQQACMDAVSMRDSEKEKINLTLEGNIPAGL